MKYYLIVGEASGDLHASHLMRSLKEIDVDAQFRFFGGDMMTAVGGTRVRHYKELAYMGFVPVLMHLPRSIVSKTSSAMLMSSTQSFHSRLISLKRNITILSIM